MACLNKPSSSSEWKEAIDPKTDKTYYYNKATRQTTWIPPKDEANRTIQMTDEGLLESNGRREPNLRQRLRQQRHYHDE